MRVTAWAMIGQEGARPVAFQQIEDYRGRAVARPGPPAAVPPRHHTSPTIETAERASASDRRDQAARQRRKLARLRRPGRKTLLPPLAGGIDATEIRVVAACHSGTDGRSARCPGTQRAARGRPSSPAHPAAAPSGSSPRSAGLRAPWRGGRTGHTARPADVDCPARAGPAEIEVRLTQPGAFIDCPYCHGCRGRGA